MLFIVCAFAASLSTFFHSLLTGKSIVASSISVSGLSVISFPFVITVLTNLEPATTFVFTVTSNFNVTVAFASISIFQTRVFPIISAFSVLSIKFTVFTSKISLFNGSLTSIDSKSLSDLFSTVITYVTFSPCFTFLSPVFVVIISSGVAFMFADANSAFTSIGVQPTKCPSEICLSGISVVSVLVIVVS